MRQASINVARKTRRYLRDVLNLLIFGALAIVCLSIFILIGSNKVEALTFNPDPTGQVPALYLWLLGGCDGPQNTESPAFAEWISPAGNPTGTEITVPAGTTTITLEYH